MNPSRRSDFIAADDRENETAEEPEDITPLKLGKKKFVGNEELTNVLTKLREEKGRSKSIARGIVNNNDEDGNYELDDDEIGNPLLQSMRKRRKKKKRLTNLFVRFMEDMTQKLNLNPLTVAKLIVHRIADKRSSV